MRLRLKRVELRNFRIHKHYVFEPDETGVTAIIGRNGHGKSTIINGIAWALYGTKPNTGIKNSAWRMIGAPEDESAWVDATFDLDGKEFRVKRTLVGPKASNVTCECWLDGKLEAGPAVSHASRWIINTLQMDEEGFLSTILVQQKHVGQLVSASRAERRKTLERLTGITAVTVALEKAKEEERAQSRIVNAFHVDETQVPKLEKKINTMKRTEEKLESSIEKERVKLSKLGQEGKALKAKVDEAESIMERKRALEAERSRVSFEHDASEDRLKELEDRKDELVAQLPESRLDPGEMAKVEGELADAESRKSGLQARITMLESSIESAPSKEDLEELDGRINDASRALDGINPVSLKEELEGIRNEKATFDAEIAQVGKSLGELDGGQATCPTCLRPIDDPVHLIGELDARMEAAKAGKAGLKPRRDEIMMELDRADGLEESVRGLMADRDAMVAAVKAAEDARRDLVPVKAELEAADALVRSLRKSVSRFEADRGRYEEYDRVLGEQTVLVRRVAETESRMAVIDKELSGLSMDEGILAGLRGELEAKRAKRSDLQGTIAGLDGDLRVAVAERTGAESELESLRDQVEAHRRALESFEVASTVSGVIGRFREHMILSAIPRVTDYASVLVESISGGAFTGIEIDKSFNITVSCGDGSVKATSQLSGGEEDLVAICLRLAISVMLSDGTPSMLILDEVLTAMDSERAEAILDAMQELSGGQIIIVAHNEVVKSIADKTIEL